MEALWTHARFHRHDRVCTGAKGSQVKLYCKFSHVNLMAVFVLLFSFNNIQTMVHP